MKFADFHAGQVLRLGPVLLSEAEIIAFAKDWDPQWFHTDAERAARGRWKGLIASGWQTCALAMRTVVEGPLAGSESFGSPGLAYLKWLAPVRPGDRLSLEATVIEARRSGSGKIGSVRWRWLMRNQDAVEVLDMEATSLFDLAGNQESAA